MSRFADIAILRKATCTTDEEGHQEVSYEESEVFCNRYTVSLENRMRGDAEGFQGVLELQVRSCDYGGQEEVEFDGVVYTVRDTYDEGEFTRISMARRLGDE